MDNQNVLPTPDHDLLIRVDTKLTQLSLDVKDVKDGLTGRVSVLETKTIAYDQILAEYPPKRNVDMLYAHEKWINDFKLTWKLVISMSIAISSVITFILMALGQTLNIIGFFGHK